MKKNKMPFFERFAAKVTKATGKPIAFILAMLIIIGWLQQALYLNTRIPGN